MLEVVTGLPERLKNSRPEKRDVRTGGTLVTIIKLMFFLGPLIFAFGFLAPLTMQIIERAGLTPPLGLSPLQAGLLVAAALGIPAQFRGRWI